MPTSVIGFFFQQGVQIGTETDNPGLDSNEDVEWQTWQTSVSFQISKMCARYAVAAGLWLRSVAWASLSL